MAKSKKARKVRKRKDFDLGRLRRQLEAAMNVTRAYSWDLESIMRARDDQIAGRFAQPVRLAAALRTDGALYTAWRNRIAPQQSIGVELKPAGSGRATSVAGEAAALFGSAGIGLTLATRKQLHGTLANHGVAVGVNDWQPREDGSRVDVYHRAWPLDYVWWDEVKRALQTWTLDESGQRRQEARCHPTPTRSPGFHTASAPASITSPTTSWPGTKGYFEMPQSLSIM